MTDHKNKKNEAFSIGICVFLLSLLVGCGKDDSDSPQRTLKNSVTANSTPALNTSTGSETKPPVVPLAGDDSAFNDFKAKMDAEKEKMAFQAAESQKQRDAQALESDKQRAHEMAIQKDRLAFKEKKQYMDSLVGLMMIQAQSDMFHPDKCANRKGFLSGLKDTAAALKEAMTATDAAGPAKPDAETAKPDTETANEPPKPPTVTEPPQGQPV